MAERYIRSLRGLPQGAPLLIYGTGGRGQSLLRSARRSRQTRVLGFVDSFKSGDCCGLPVFPLARLAEALRGEALAGAHMVVASAFHRAICRDLRALGIENFSVFLDKCDGPPLMDLAPQEVLSALGTYRHPLLATRKRPIQTRGRSCRCDMLWGVYLRPSGLSLCCWLPDLAEHCGNEATLARLDAVRANLVRGLDQGKNPYCASCPDLVPDAPSPSFGRYRMLNLDFSVRCNLNCSYCVVKNTHSACSYDARGLVDHILDTGGMAENFAFGWGGNGEPTINPDFAHLTGRCLALGGQGLVYTNAVHYSEVIAEALASRRLSIHVSLDAGSRETYARIRGVDRYDKVWANIRRYLKIWPEGVNLKYIVVPDNMAEGELLGFARKCAEAGARKVVLSRDFYRACKDDDIRALRFLSRECASRGLSVSFLGTAVPEDVREPAAGDRA
jgi:sulfatase maturation enzyme AslB (radical SAM superfamily)